MEKLFERLLGCVRVRVEEGRGEALLNLCASKNIRFTNAARDSGGAVELDMTLPAYRKLESAAKDRGISIRPVKKRGLPFFARTVKNRWGLFLGMAVCVAAVWISSLFIWELDVSGNDRVSKGEILDALAELGVKTGTCRLSVNQEYISNEILQKIPELSWIAVNVSGSHGQVLVKEADPAPTMIDENTPTLVYAKKSGIISKITVLDGSSLFKVGDAVCAGETIVTGKMDSISSGARFVHAMAQVYAETKYDLSAQMPENVTVKSYTGAKKTRFALILGGKRVNLYFFGGNPWPYYDKITTVSPLRIWGGTVLPFTLVKDVYKKYEPAAGSVNTEAAESLLKARLSEQLRREIGEDGEILSVDFFTASEGGMLTVTMSAKCLEQIGTEREMAPEELLVDEDPINTEEE